LGSARASRAGDDALVIANLSLPEYEKNIKSVSARCRNQHAGRMRSPEVQLLILLNLTVAST